MKRVMVRLLVVAALLFPVATAVEAAPKRAMASWQQLTPEQQTILQPVRGNWNRMHYKQRERLLALAAKYPRMSAVEKQRFEARLPQWAALTRAERDLTRKRYAAFSKLPPERRAAYQKEWDRRREQTGRAG